jgi:hypothetical protein
MAEHPGKQKNASMTAEAAIAWVKKHGIALESGHGPVPNLAEEITGEPIKGSWWGHKLGMHIYEVSRVVRKSPEVLVCKMIDGKITYIHQRLWPALVRLSDRFDAKKLTAIHERHTATGTHRVDSEPYPNWVPKPILDAAKALDPVEAEQQLAVILKKKRSNPAL